MKMDENFLIRGTSDHQRLLRGNNCMQKPQASPLTSHTSLIWQHLPMPPTPSGPWHVSRTDPPCVALRGTLNVYLHTQTKAP